MTGVPLLTVAALVALALATGAAIGAVSAPGLTPEECFGSVACRADVDGSGTITMVDWSEFLKGWEAKSWAASCLAAPACRFDFDRSGTITTADFSAMLAEAGRKP